MLDFLYGETIGWIEGYIIRSFIETYKREPSTSELAEISSVIVLYSDQIRKNFRKERPNWFSYGRVDSMPKKRLSKMEYMERKKI